jgi:hypothetical protein
MAINRAANGETLSRTLATTIIAALGGNDQLFGDEATGLPDGGRDDAAGPSDDEEAAARRDTNVVPLFNLFRPF